MGNSTFQFIHCKNAGRNLPLADAPSRSSPVENENIKRKKSKKEVQPHCVEED